MKVAIIFLDYERHQHTKAALKSIAAANYPFDLFTIQKKGVSAAINEGIAKAKGYDAIVTCANDIVMPDGWLAKMVETVKAIPNTGMCGIHCVESLELPELINHQFIHPAFTAFGNVMIPTKVFDAVGVFNEDYDPYGMQDGDFAYRLNKAGFINYYIHGMKSEHIGHDVGEQTEYRKMKDEGLKEAKEKWEKWTALYDEGDYIINYPQYLGEWA